MGKITITMFRGIEVKEMIDLMGKLEMLFAIEVKYIVIGSELVE